MKNEILELLNLCESYKKRIQLTLLCYVKSDNLEKEPIENQIMQSEFFSKHELNELMTSCRKFGIYTNHYSDQDLFMSRVIDGSFKVAGKDINIVYDTTQKGINLGKNSLIPAFCDLHNIFYTGPNAYINSLLSSKYDWSSILNAHDFSIPKTNKYSDRFGWLTNDIIAKERIIIKPNAGCASIGIDLDSSQLYTPSTDVFINNKSEKFKMPMVIQEFISGYEVEVPVIVSSKKILVLPPVGIETNSEKDLGDNFLNYDLVYNDNYKFYNFSNEFPDITKAIRATCIEIVKTLEITGHCRIDFRIKNVDKTFYVTDINAHPHIVNHSSFAESFRFLELNSELALPALIGNVLHNNGYSVIK